MRVEAKAAVPVLINALKDPAVHLRRRAADALYRIGVGATAAMPALINALKDQDADVRGSAAEALGAIGIEARAAVPALIDALKDDDSVPSRNGKTGYNSVSELAYMALNSIDPEVAGKAGSPLPPRPET
jgi:HEAT repeat protein